MLTANVATVKRQVCRKQKEEVGTAGVMNGGGDGLGSHWSYKESTLCRSESRLCSQSFSESGALSRLIGTFFSVA